MGDVAERTRARERAVWRVCGSRSEHVAPCTAMGSPGTGALRAFSDFYPDSKYLFLIQSHSFPRLHTQTPTSCLDEKLAEKASSPITAPADKHFNPTIDGLCSLRHSSPRSLHPLNSRRREPPSLSRPSPDAALENVCAPDDRRDCREARVRAPRPRRQCVPPSLTPSRR